MNDFFTPINNSKLFLSFYIELMPKGTKVVFEATTKDFESCYPEKNQKRKISIPYEPFSKTPNFVHFTMFFNFICIDLYICLLYTSPSPRD